MNLSQITRLAQYQAGLVKQSGTAGSFVSVYELDGWANSANGMIERELRSYREDFFVKRMVSTDTTAQFLQGISYTPTTLNLAVSTRIFTLPPDFQSIKSIRCVTEGYEETKFTYSSLTTKDFGDASRSADDDTVSPGEGILYTIYGARTLLLARCLDTALDIEILYVTKQKPLVRYSTGTVAVTTGTDDVAGTLTVWTYQPLDDDFLDIHFGTSTVATVPTPEPSYEYDGVNRMRVSSITDATNIVLTSNKVGTLAAGTGYLLASLPQVPVEYHQAIVNFVTAHILTRAESASAKTYFAMWSDTLKSIKGELPRHQTEDIPTVEDFDPYGAERY